MRPLLATDATYGMVRQNACSVAFENQVLAKNYLIKHIVRTIK
jgi:hypothetical protein